MPYEVIREYTGNNDYHVKFLYLKTENKIPQSHLESLVKKYNQDHPNKYSSKGFFLYHNEEYYATALNFESRRFGWNQKDTMVVEEYVTDKKSFIAKRDSIINAKRAELEMHPKDSILCYCDYFFNPFVANKIIYKKWDTGTFRLPNMNGIKVELNKKDFYKQFLKYGDTNQDVFSLHFSKPYKDTPYHSLHYINDFGDMVIKQDRDSGILSVCRKWNH